MIDFFFQMGLSNACLSLALGIMAMVVGAKAKRPHLAHMLWLLVFIKLVTPPIVTIPIVTIPGQGETAFAINDHSRPGPLLSDSRQLDIEASLWSKLGSTAWNHTRVWLPPIWLLGSMVVFAWSMVRVCRFSRLLAKKSEVAPQELQTAAEKTAHRLRLKTIPIICTTSARISPMVWWTGGKVRIVIPTTLLDQMDAQQSQWILAHELAHVRRRDYLVRWLEWLACVFFWWNPVVWWAQRNLRAMEEICCDDLVMSCLNPKPKFYADSLLSAMEFLARPVLRPPAMASEINSGGFLERRFKMIVSNKSKKSNSRWLQICVLLCALVVLPLGIASAQDYEAVERRLGKAVAEGELTLKQASIMMDALRKAGGAGKDQELERAKAYLMEVKKELGAAIEADEISWEDAAKKYEAAEKEIKEKLARQDERDSDHDRRDVDDEMEAVGRRIRLAVAAGKITPEQGRARWEAYKKRMEGAEHQSDSERITREDYEGFERRIKAAVRQGIMTRAEAGEKLEGFRRRMEMAERGERGITIEEYRRAEEKMRKMVEEGKAKPEDVERRLIEMRRMIRDEGERSDRERPDWEGIKRRIEGAVKSGRITRAEADEKYREIRERMVEQRGR